MTTIDASLRALEIQGTTVPKLGFGTWEILGRDCEEAVTDALEIGYRHVDTAQAYDNEAEVGKALAASAIPRKELFLTTKLWRDEYAPERVRPSAEGSLERLQVDCVDLLLLHWPNDAVPLEETLGALADLREDGLIKHFGVSNFPAGHAARGARGRADLRRPGRVPPLPRPGRARRDGGRAGLHGHRLLPARPRQGPADPALREIGEAHGKSAGQVALRWLLDKPNVCAIPKASSHERRVENFEVFDFELTDEERARIDALPKDERVIDPGWAPDWDA